MSSSSSFVTFTGNAMLENPRSASPQVVFFGMVVYVGSPSLRNITGSVKEEGNKATYPEIGMYGVTATICGKDGARNRGLPRRKGQPVPLRWDNKRSSLPAMSIPYSVLTYIQFYLLEELPENNRWNINPAQLSTIHVCCFVTKDDQKAAAFQGEPEQYTIAFAEAKCKAEEAGFMGYLTGVSGALEGAEMVDRFRIEVETISFMGNYMKKQAKLVKKIPAPTRIELARTSRVENVIARAPWKFKLSSL
ncbi:hypothetical protein DFH07DRAFT_781196 [Mycena maculata]|uniref:Uncharacterized protein n=1 Tax=Mycena maculata TaxID=230809 RepID=A0AAD7HZ94_9AGAR|nr:hypothetical protein DFH07DRAFT_781196 [Mycena maculata]